MKKEKGKIKWVTNGTMQIIYVVMILITIFISKSQGNLEIMGISDFYSKAHSSGQILIFMCGLIYLLELMFGWKESCGALIVDIKTITHVYITSYVLIQLFGLVASFFGINSNLHNSKPDYELITSNLLFSIVLFIVLLICEFYIPILISKAFSRKKDIQQKEFSNVFNLKVKNDKKLLIIRLLLNQTQQELIEDKYRNTSDLAKTFSAIKKLSETLDKICSIQDEEVKEKIIESTLAILKVDYGAFYSFYGLVRKYNITDEYLFPKTELNKVNERYAISNNDCLKLFELGVSASAKRINERTAEEREDTKRIIDNTFKMLG